MAVPNWQEFFLPVLKLAGEEKQEIRIKDAIEKISDRFGFTPEERAEKILKSGQNRIYHRISWVVTDLVTAGYLERPARGVFKITEEGLAALAKAPGKIDRNFLQENSEKFKIWFQENKSGKSGKEQVRTEITVENETETPEERIDSAFKELEKGLKQELLERIIAMSPAAFEHLILDVMRGMGYGKDGSHEHLGGTGDGGVDGVINEDVLGLDVIYLQAKRYQKGNTVSVREVREFSGSLIGHGASKGVFMTTSSFAPGAREFIKNIPQQHIVLIDGERLTRLMIDYGVAVRVAQNIEIKKVDLDYFEDLGG